MAIEAGIWLSAGAVAVSMLGVLLSAIALWVALSRRPAHGSAETGTERSRAEATPAMNGAWRPPANAPVSPPEPKLNLIDRERQS